MENSFDSIDRLLEFGMSMTVAQQMIKTMNCAMANMNVPGMGYPIPKNEVQYYAVMDNTQFGPFPEDEIGQLITSGKLTGSSLVWKTGLQRWVEARTLPEINKVMMLHKMSEP